MYEKTYILIAHAQIREAFAAAEPYITLAEPKLIDSRKAQLQRIKDLAAMMGVKIEMLSDGRVVVGQRTYAPDDAIGAIRVEGGKTC